MELTRAAIRAHYFGERLEAVRDGIDAGQTEDRLRELIAMALDAQAALVMIEPET